MPIRPQNTNQIRSDQLDASHIDHVHTGADGSDQVAHSDLSGVGTDDHHAEAHTVASHSDTTATGAELETLTDGSDADALHTHGEFDTHTHTESDVTDLDHDDTDAIHDNVAAEISAITDKATPAAGDHFVIEDSAASDAKKSLEFSSLEATIDHGSIAGLSDNDHTQYLHKTNDAVNDIADVTDWTTYNPTLNNITEGNGTKIARYTQIGKTVMVYLQFELGSTSSVDGTVVFDLPVECNNSYNTDTQLGFARLTNAGTTAYFGQVYAQNTFTEGVPQVMNADSTYIEVRTFLSATKPHAWAAGDRMTFMLTYEAA